MTDVDDACLTVSEDLAPYSAQAESAIASLSFNACLDPPLYLQTDETECGGQLWPAGMVLAEYLIRQKLDDLKGKTMFAAPKRSDVVLAQWH